MMGVSVSHDCACAGEERMATRTYYDCAAGWLRWEPVDGCMYGCGWKLGKRRWMAARTYNCGAGWLGAGLEVDGCCTDVQLRALLAG